MGPMGTGVVPALKRRVLEVPGTRRVVEGVYGRLNQRRHRRWLREIENGRISRVGLRLR